MATLNQEGKLIFNGFHSSLIENYKQQKVTVEEFENSLKWMAKAHIGHPEDISQIMYMRGFIIGVRSRIIEIDFEELVKTTDEIEKNKVKALLEDYRAATSNKCTSTMMKVCKLFSEKPSESHYDQLWMYTFYPDCDKESKESMKWNEASNTICQWVEYRRRKVQDMFINLFKQVKEKRNRDPEGYGWADNSLLYKLFLSKEKKDKKKRKRKFDDSRLDTDVSVLISDDHTLEESESDDDDDDNNNNNSNNVVVNVLMIRIGRGDT
jgi:hypothetical protein